MCCNLEMMSTPKEDLEKTGKKFKEIRLAQKFKLFADIWG